MAANTTVQTVSGQVFECHPKYKIIKPIGSGAYGLVVSAEDSETGQKVAIKKVPKAFEDCVDAKRILREIKLMRHFNHENVVNIMDMEVPTTVEYDDIYIISELMETDLHRIITSKQQLSMDHVQYFVYQLLRALKYIHSANTIHRDLKPSNVLLNANCDLKLCDFGLARGVAEDGDGQLTEYVVTRWYRAPEIMLSCKEYTKAVDMWSVGCIMAELMLRKPIFPGSDYMDMLKRIVHFLGSPSEEDMGFIKQPKALAFMRKQGGKPRKEFRKYFPDASDEALDLMGRMLEFNPAKRITVEEALAHPFMEGLHQAEDEPECETPFDSKWEDFELTKENLRRMVLEEIALFRPEAKPLVAEAQAAQGGSHK